MDQKLFLEKLTEVADWHWEQYRGESKDGRVWGDEEREKPTYPYIDRVKTKTCPYQKIDKVCLWKIYKKGYANTPEILVQRCEVCGALLTPKGNFIPKPATYNYPLLIRLRDEDE